MPAPQEIRATIIRVMAEVADESGKELASDFGDASVLLQSGLDSLDFAIIVARLEDEFEDDPFAAMDEPVYPVTLADFIGVYETFFASAA